MNDIDNIREISLRRIFGRFRSKLLVTWFLVLGEGALFLLFPLFMGLAIDGLLGGEYIGLAALLSIGFLSLLTGAARRFYDTRVYAKIYVELAAELVELEKSRDASVSIVSARVDMVNEFVEFLENSFPEIISSAIALVGSLTLIFFLQLDVFIACLVSSVAIVVVYAVTSQKTYTLNRGFNDELEKRVAVLSKHDKPAIQAHFKTTMTWNIRLSDLETVNFSLSWILLIGVLGYAIIATIQGGITAHGKVLSILMYVFNYIESVLSIPLFYQQFVRLKEISHRLDLPQSNDVGLTP